MTVSHLLLPMVYRVACYHSTANVTLVRHNPQNAEVTIVNYFITREVQHFVPITIDIYHNRVFLAAFRCENGNIVDRGSAIGEVAFTGRCQDPTVVITNNITVSISLDLFAVNSDIDPTCSNVLVGPQSENVKFTFIRVYIIY